MTWRDRSEIGPWEDPPRLEDRSRCNRVPSVDKPAGSGRWPDLAIVRGGQTDARMVPAAPQKVRKPRTLIRVRARRRRGA